MSYKYNNSKKLASPSFFGSGALIVVGAVSLNNEINSMGLEMMADNITKVIIEVERAMEYFSICTNNNETLSSLLASPKYNWWGRDTLPIFNFDKPNYFSSDQILFAIKDKSLNGGRILRVGGNFMGLQPSEYNEYLPVSKVVRLIGESELQGVKVYLHPNGNYGTIKFIKNNNLFETQTFFDLLKFKKTCIKSYYNLDNRNPPS